MESHLNPYSLSSSCFELCPATSSSALGEAALWFIWYGDTAITLKFKKPSQTSINKIYPITAVISLGNYKNLENEFTSLSSWPKTCEVKLFLQ